MATLDEILPQDKALAQLRLPEIVGAQEQERIDSVRRAAVRALEKRAGVWLLTGKQSKAGYFTPCTCDPSTITLTDFVTDIASMSYQNADGTTSALAVNKVKLFERIERGMRVIKVIPVGIWPPVRVDKENFALLKMEVNVGATADQVDAILNSGWETYLRLMLSGYYDSRYLGGREGQPLDHSTAEREAEGLKKPMAV